MDETWQSLLLRARTGEENAWKDLTDLYRPLILGWLNRQGVPARDLDDLSQDILPQVVDPRGTAQVERAGEGLLGGATSPAALFYRPPPPPV
jgi:hypothetical protein